MLRRLGYACLCLSVDDSSPRGTILRSATPERLRALTAANLVRKLPDAVRARLVSESDERLFGADGVLVASAGTGVPVVHFLALAPPDVEFDCMLEAKAKAKDLALFRVRDALGIAA